MFQVDTMSPFWL